MRELQGCSWGTFVGVLSPPPFGSGVHVCACFLLEHLFLRAFWQTMIREWVGIDRLRLDKFYMVRQVWPRLCSEAPKR